MSMWILKQNGEIVSRTTLFTLTEYELASETEKTKIVAGGHTTNPPAESTYSGVVSREFVRIDFTFGALNELDMIAAGIQNACINAPCALT